jgi:hypothetical protein
VHDLQRQVHPDFHHHPDLVESGALVDFLPDAAADAFCARGSAAEVAGQLIDVLSIGVDFEIVVPHPVPNPPPPIQREGESSGATYMERMAREVFPLVRAAVG